ncbi:hypothetical protein C9374_010700 [Naegleria lovaniensis]|uniref:PDZ GRASP-type domain-containing protein n=1 Tax=Naegleria lovaniensis TaxID=51637 RepID=A0AA88GHV4_NAELO|nr:uncharacterized protein C9374_010700 [Naegleria lovaniensis]KAG2374416.1 hypothetical protein C9374_010700 [Naegleria lovaniensis]
MGNSVPTNIPSENIVGYQVISVAPHSPAEKAGLCPYFDFILSMDDIDLSIEDRQFFLTYISRSLNQPLKMTVFSLKTMKQRLVTVIPRQDWNITNFNDGEANNNNEISAHSTSESKKDGSDSSQNTATSNITNKSMCLGCSIRYESVKNALNCVWHVIGVQPNSPADRASIHGDGTDYIVGFDNRLFSEPNELTELLSYYQGSMSSSSIYLSLYVYNWRLDSFRHVVVNMSEKGHLGIELGTGYLHIIPPPLSTSTVTSFQHLSLVSNQNNGLHLHSSTLPLSTIEKVHSFSNEPAVESNFSLREEEDYVVVQHHHPADSSEQATSKPSSPMQSTSTDKTNNPSNSMDITTVHATTSDMTTTPQSSSPQGAVFYQPSPTTPSLTERSTTISFSLPSSSITSASTTHQAQQLYSIPSEEKNSTTRKVETLNINIASYNPFAPVDGNEELSLGDIIGEHE